MTLENPCAEGWIEAPLDACEEERLAALGRYRLLDTPPEDEFNTITELARRIFNVPIALVSLVDRERQWFKSHAGIDAKETPRNLAFCAHAILRDETLVIPDAALDERFRKNPLVTGEPNIRFYAGAPLIMKDGVRIGTLCLIDQLPHADFDDEKQRRLAQLADTVARLIEMRLAWLTERDKNSAKSEFLAHMSHELRTPLNAIIGIANLLEYSPSMLTQTPELLQTLSSSANSLLAIINSVLDLSAIEARNFELVDEEFSILALVEELERMIRVKAQEKTIELRIEAEALKGLSCRGDQTRLRQMLVNLLGNAVKFTDDGHVRLHAERVKDAHNKSWLQFTVEDSGIGIEADQLASLFERFARAPSSSKREGTGLGLAITRQLAERMGGSITVESEAGKGSKFILRIPDTCRKINETKQTESGSSDDSKAHTASCRILLAEDYPANIMIASHVIGSLGYTHDVAQDGRDAVSRHTDTPYDFILMDVNMPTMSGIEATKEIRLRENGAGKRRCTIIGLTAHAFESDRQKCIDAGMDDFLTKPITPDQLAEKLRRHVAKQAA